MYENCVDDDAVIAHERLHKYGLSDLEQLGNVMYYKKQRPKGTKVGNRKLKRRFYPGFDKQWDVVNR